MISKGQARVLKHLSKSWCYQREMLKEATVLELAELLGENYAQIRHFTGDGSNKIVITDTGRLALEEFEGAQAVSADASPVVSDAAKIAALEAENAALRGMLAKALDAIAPVESAVSYDDNLERVFEDTQLIVETPDRFEEIYISAWDGNKGDCLLRVKHLRAIATIAADIRAALDPTTPYENTPDGSDLLARDTEADDDE